MATTTVARSAPPLTMQGIAVPSGVVDQRSFLALTRRHTLLEKTDSYDGVKSQSVFELRKSDILAGITIRFTGTLVVTPGTGTVASTFRYPLDLIKQCRFTANGQSNLINVSGAKLKVRDVMKLSDLNDRGVTNVVGGVSRSQGTLARASEAWGVGSMTPNLTGGSYPVELEWYVPVAEDDVDLTGAIFLATSSSDLTLTLDWEALGNLFITTGNGTAALTGTVQVLTKKFSIPVSNGQLVLPDLSSFHSLIQNRYTALQNGENEVKIVGQGAGKALVRLYYQFQNGATTAAAPLAMNTANFSRQSWRYGNNETPEEFIDGNHMRIDCERRYNTDIGGLWGFGCHDFAVESAFRDVVDMGTTGELRFVSVIQNAVALSSPAVEYVTETVYGAGQAT